jgi:hypothetical protein
MTSDQLMMPLIRSSWSIMGRVNYGYLYIGIRHSISRNSFRIRAEIKSHFIFVRPLTSYMKSSWDTGCRMNRDVSIGPTIMATTFLQPRNSINIKGRL